MIVVVAIVVVLLVLAWLLTLPWALRERKRHRAIVGLRTLERILASFPRGFARERNAFHRFGLSVDEAARAMRDWTVRW